MKISREQYLNDVHYIIQIVRHSMIHGPSDIEIRSTSDTLRIHQNGRPIEPEEWHLITILCGAYPGSDEAVHQAVRRMENRYGTALLTVVRNFRHIAIRNAAHRLVLNGDDIRLESSPPMDGYTVSIMQGSRDRRREWRELVYFCSTCTVPIHYNGKTVTGYRPEYDLILTARDHTNAGSGECGIPRSGSLNTLDYRKTGIRFGTKSEFPVDGRVIRGHFDSGVPGFEPHYRDSIRNADEFFRTAAVHTYARSLSLFSELAESDKLRLKRLLFSMPGADNAAAISDVPVFHSVHGRFRLSPAHLERLNTWFDFVPYSPVTTTTLPAFIPVLDSNDLRYIGKTYGYTVKLIPRGRGRSRSRDVNEPAALLNDDIRPDSRHAVLSGESMRDFLRALNAGAGPYSFSLGTRWNRHMDDTGAHHIEIDGRSRIIPELFTVWNTDPKTMPVARWKIIATATRYRDKGRYGAGVNP